MSSDDDRPDMPSGDLFDEHGLFTGEIGKRIWGQLCLRIEEDLEERGWDQPARLLAVSNPLHTEAAVGFDVTDLVRERARHRGPEAPVDPDLLLDGIGIALTPVADIAGPPVESLWGHTAPAWADALVLTFEGWVVPPLFDDDGTRLPDEHADLPNSQHPRRVEVRRVIMLTRSGVQYEVSRWRGEDPEIVGDGSGGLVVEVLRRMLRLPTDPPPTTTGDLLGRLALMYALTVTARVADPSPVRGVKTDVPPGVLAEADQVHAGLSAMSAEDRQEVVAAVLGRTFVSSVAHVVWKVSDHGERGIAKPHRRLVRDVAYKGATSSEHLRVVLEAAASAADLSFVEVAAGKRARDLLPPEVAAAPAGWADDGILARRLCWRQWMSQPELRAEVARLVGTVPAVVGTVLEQAGWASTEPAGPRRGPSG